MEYYTLTELASRALDYAKEMKENGGKDIVKSQPPKEKKPQEVKNKKSK